MEIYLYATDLDPVAEHDVLVLAVVRLLLPDLGLLLHDPLPGVQPPVRAVTPLLTVLSSPSLTPSSLSLSLTCFMSGLRGSHGQRIGQSRHPTNNLIAGNLDIRITEM